MKHKFMQTERGGATVPSYPLPITLDKSMSDYLLKVETEQRRIVVEK